MIAKIKANFSTIILVFILLVGLSFLLYPTVSDYWNSFHQSEAIAGYVDKVNNLTQQENDRMLADAKAYNDSLAKNSLPDLNLMAEERTSYNQILDVSDTGIMAYVDIPKIKTTMPIYHGTDAEILQVAIGHIPGTSLPIGGKGTHAVISGHRGLPSAKLFTDLDQLVEGDIFYIQVLDQTLTYEVDQILTVTPDDVSPLTIDPDQDYVTLVTCTPYGVNSHRLLVRGHRIANEAKEARVTSEASQVDPILVAPFIAGLLLLVIPIFLSFKKRFFR
ncbi:class C sortase [Streptococcus parasuis]|uniref:class C sortase n=1 Tax=Streptococcus parasuis TaxID=1501662 RepID=UPI00241272E0|nr:class C sortase [Streptococcus parasuis]MDG4478044.1 class C sortase [Streptococcus parasuis]